MNNFGQLGIGSYANSATPTEVLGLSSATAIAVGQDFSCAVVSSGEVLCWGMNDAGQLGTGQDSGQIVGAYNCDPRCPFEVAASPPNDSKAFLTPTSVVGLPEPIKTISSGQSDTCALSLSGNIYCWGANTSGELGVGDGQIHYEPVKVTGLSGLVTEVSVADDHSCALLTDGSVDCWGSNATGDLGTGDKLDSLVPRMVLGLPEPMSSVTAYSGGSCATGHSGKLYCWGGSGPELSTCGPAGIPLPGVMDGFHSHATQVTGQFGSPGATIFLTVGTGASDQPQCSGMVRSRFVNQCALDGGGVICWGTNPVIPLGNGREHFSDNRSYLPGLESGVTSLSYGEGQTTCAIKNADIYCWGASRYGTLGQGVFGLGMVTLPTIVIGVPSATSVDSSLLFGCSLSNGQVWCFGGADAGERGFVPLAPSLNHPPASSQVAGLPLAAQTISTGYNHACTILSDKSAWCWGDNSFGELGNSSHDAGYACTTTNPFSACVVGDGSIGGVAATSPVPVEGLGDVAEVSGGNSFTCALKLDQSVWCWGRNREGQLGNATTIDSPSPVQVQGLGASTEVVAGSNFACAVEVTGLVKCWGDNSAGELARGDTVSSDVAVPATLLPIGTSHLSLNKDSFYGCGVTADAKAICWGSYFWHSDPRCASYNVQGAGYINCWGSFQNFVLVKDPITLGPEPGTVQLPTAVSTVSANIVGGVCARLIDSRVFCWGMGLENLDDPQGYYTAGGIPFYVSTPTGIFLPSNSSIPRPPPLSAQAIGGPCAIDSGGSTVCWKNIDLNGTPGYAPMKVPVDWSLAAPEVSQVTFGSDGATISWDSSVQNADTTYRVIASPDLYWLLNWTGREPYPTGLSCVSSENRCTIPNLDPNKKYTFFIQLLHSGLSSTFTTAQVNHERPMSLNPSTTSAMVGQKVILNLENQSDTTGESTFLSYGDNCSIVGNVLTASLPTICTVTAKRLIGLWWGFSRTWLVTHAVSIVFHNRASSSSPLVTNLPSSGIFGGSFTPVVATTGDGATSVATSTPSVCAVVSGTVNYIGVGTCTLVPHVETGTNYASADGASQSFTVSRTPSSSPTNVSVRPIVTATLLVTWSPPLNNGGSQVKNYVATASPGGQKCTVQGTSCTIVNLDPSTPYNVQVTANNESGPSLPSSPSMSIYPVTSNSMKVTVIPPFVSPALPFTVLVYGAQANKNVTLAVPSSQIQCLTNAAGQCTVSLNVKNPGAYAVSASLGKVTTVSLFYAPRISVPLGVKHGKSFTVAITYAPTKSRVTITLGDGTTKLGTTNGAGALSVSMPTSKAGLLKVTVSIGGISLGNSAVLVS